MSSSGRANIALRRLHRFFGDTRAVNDISFEVFHGEVFGYIGPNGAGKTTSMRILATLDLPTYGDALVDGFSVVNDPDRVRRRLGFMPDSFGTYHNVNCREYLDFFARAYGLMGRERDRALRYVMGFTGLDRLAEKPIHGLSKGMKQRLCLGRSMIHDPSVLILDEPAAGLDPRARIELRNMIRSLAADGKTILISSHILTELAEMCDRVGILELGRVVAIGTVDEIQRGHTQQHHTLTEIKMRLLQENDSLVNWLAQRTGVSEVRTDGEHVRFAIEGGREEQTVLLKELVMAGFEVAEYGGHAKSLEEVFLHVTRSGSMMKASASISSMQDESPFENPLSPGRRAACGDHVEAWLVRCSEWFNPILVKEARQALKSWQFVITFSLLLMFGWGWSLMGVALLSPGIYFAPGGRTMLTGYTLILLIPMLVIVPFTAFRSLAAEREDGTFDLLSITSLNARQIVTGKLGSAILQMVVYYSALAPSIAFTYLLRGIDILTIILILFYAFLLSILLSAFGLLQATVTRSWQWQALLAVSLILALGFADFIVSYAAVATIWMGGSLEFDNVYFWIGQAAFLSFYATFLILMILAAASRLSFASDNRSTKLRVVMFVQQGLWIFWMTYVFLESEQSEALYFILPVAGIYWYIIGGLMTGEEAVMSPRVRRSLPQSFAGRMFFTWFNPGSDTGFIFVILNLWTMALAVIALTIAGQMTGVVGTSDPVPIISLTTLTAAYVTIYLGVGRLFTLMIQRIVSIGVVIPLLLQIMLAAFGAFVPFVLSGWIQGFSDITYTPLQVSNWAWTLAEAGDGDLWSWAVVPISLYVMAAVMLLIHLVIAFREVEFVRAETPQRVVEDELLLHPERAIQVRRPASPWDDTPTNEAGTLS